MPVRPRLSLVEFKSANFAPPGAPSEEELRAYYSANMASFPVPADPDKKDAALPDTAVDNFPKVRAQVEAALRDVASRHMAAAVKRHSEFFNILFRRAKVLFPSLRSGSFDRAVAEYGRL